jgi:hypothetical protein
VLTGGRGPGGGCAGTRVDVTAAGTIDLALPAATALVLQSDVRP